MLVRIISLGRFSSGNIRKGTEGEYEIRGPEVSGARASVLESKINATIKKLVIEEGCRPDLISVAFEYIVTGNTSGHSEAFLLASFNNKT